MKAPDGWVFVTKVSKTAICVDGKELITCKSCVHYKPFLHKKNRKYCFKHDHVTTANDFCSFAERKEV